MARTAGERFVLLTRETLAVVDVPLGLLDAQVRVLAKGAGDPVEVETAAAMRGAALVPPAPVHLRARLRGNGATEVRWVRRSRAGWDWIDGVDAPLGEESERYRVTIRSEGGAARVVEVSEPRLVLGTGERAAGCTIIVAQLGAQGLSLPAELRLLELGEGE